MGWNKKLLGAAIAAIASAHLAARPHPFHEEPSPVSERPKRDKSEARAARREQIRRNGGKR